MYSRNSRDREYSVPPGYDGSRFRRRRRADGERFTEDEIILVPDSGFAPVSDPAEDGSSRELSVGGIPTVHGLEDRRRSYTSAEDDPQQPFDEPPIPTEDTPKEKLTTILEKLGFTGGISSDELLICAVIFLIASDVADEGRSVGDVLLILALLLGIR